METVCVYVYRENIYQNISKAKMFFIVGEILEKILLTSLIYNS